ncbi:peptide-methionine (S)-S-oxide reductase MsrA [Spirochaeta cellobiosiphila]|uniref:peptide-methionine (S)-S-oxide reductase MsrA n=1 Tax=Spirochaeta cellobiosiphila TaxID=504483 RepID=UPI0004272306|nr:peptide-methionine (S)-S-oxide reductase MsrA [Spirochaeta cellobiosiphila]
MKYLSTIILLLTAVLTGSLWSQGSPELRGPLPEWKDQYTMDQVETAVFAGGCFWGVEGVYEQLKGVLDVHSGYAGGSEKTAHYNMVSSGATGHAESVQIIYDPSIISYKTLLEVFFTVAHDPTQLNYQGPDRGTQYRSAIFYVNEQQRQEAERYIKADKRDIVTLVSPLKKFYMAEKYHQDFMRLNPDYPYIRYWDLPKIVELKAQYPELLAQP